jgi:tetratricopeptide (TPR) repeat protein
VHPNIHWPRLIRAAAIAVPLTLAGRPLKADPGDALDTGGGGIAQRYVTHCDQASDHAHITEALEYCNRAIKLYPAFMAARYIRAETLLYSGAYDQAAADFTSAIAAYPEYPNYYIGLGVVYLRQHKPEQAIAALNHAMAAKTGVEITLAAYAFIYRGMAFEMMNHPNEAIADFAEALKQMYGYQYGWSVLARACYTAAVVGMNDTASLYCDESISEHPRNELAYDGKGLASLKHGDFNNAVENYTKALYYQDDNAFDLYGRALAHRALGESAAAESDIAAATKVEPAIAQIMQRLGINPPPATTAKAP